MGILTNRRDLITGAGALGVTSLLPAVSWASDRLVVVAHKSVPQSSFTSSELAAIFTTRRRNYEGGGRIVPLNFMPRHLHRVQFDQRVLGMGPDEVARYWIDRRVRGGNTPPRHVPSPALLTRLVDRLPGAISYVPESMAGKLNIVARV